MARRSKLAILALLFLTASNAAAQRGSRSSSSCTFSGTYRINVEQSDKLYSIVKDATSTVAFGEQQRFFIDFSTRLTPPDILAIECRGPQVSVGSSRAARVTYLADGRTRRERGASGGFVNSKIEMRNDSVTFISAGKADDNVNVAFQSMDDGDRLRVTRRIYAAQLTEPIVIRTVYDRVTPSVDWADFDESAIARRGNDPPPNVADPPSPNRSSESSGGNASVINLREALADWIEATNHRDIDGQMRFYVPVLKAYYLSRNTPASAVRAEKNRVFSGVRSVDIKAGEPEIIFQDDGRTAVMRFVKEYTIAARASAKSGAVVQELRWQRSGDRWRIFSERDIRVIR